MTAKDLCPTVCCTVCHRQITDAETSAGWPVVVDLPDYPGELVCPDCWAPEMPPPVVPTTRRKVRQLADIGGVPIVIDRWHGNTWPYAVLATDYGGSSRVIAALNRDDGPRPAAELAERAIAADDAALRVAGRPLAESYTIMALGRGATSKGGNK